MYIGVPVFIVTNQQSSDLLKSSFLANFVTCTQLVAGIFHLKGKVLPRKLPK